MPKYTVDEVLDIINGLSTAEQRELQTRLTESLASGRATPTTQQTRSMSIGGDFQVGGTGNTLDMSQNQVLNAPPSCSEDASAETTQALLQALAMLQQQVLNSTALNSIEKATAKVPLDTVADELKKDKPNKDLIDQSVDALKKGLAGVEALAEPVKRVAILVAKAMVVL